MNKKILLTGIVLFFSLFLVVSYALNEDKIDPQLLEKMPQFDSTEEVPIILAISKDCERIEEYKQIDPNEPPQKVITFNCTLLTPLYTILNDLKSIDIILDDNKINELKSPEEKSITLFTTKSQINSLSDFDWVEIIYYNEISKAQTESPTSQESPTGEIIATGPINLQLIYLIAGIILIASISIFILKRRGRIYE